MSKQNKKNPSTTNQCPSGTQNQNPQTGMQNKNPMSTQNKNQNPSTSNQCPSGTSSKKNDQQY